MLGVANWLKIGGGGKIKASSPVCMLMYRIWGGELMLSTCLATLDELHTGMPYLKNMTSHVLYHMYILAKQ